MNSLDRLKELLGEMDHFPDCYRTSDGYCNCGVVEARALVEQLGAVSPQGIEAALHQVEVAWNDMIAPYLPSARGYGWAVIPREAIHNFRAYLAGAAEGGSP